VDPIVTDIAAGPPPPTQPPRPRPWCGLLSIAAPLVGVLGCSCVLASNFNPIRGNGFEANVAPGVLFWCGATLLGVVLAVFALRRGERWHWLGIAGVVLNGALAPMLALWWIQNAPQGPVQQAHRERENEMKQVHIQELERERKILRLRLTHEKPPDWLRLTQISMEKEFDSFQRISSDGPMTGSIFRKGVTANVIWTEPRQFELTINVATDEVALKIEVAKLRDVSASNDGQPIALPVDLPAGKRRVIIKGQCP
jgi:hypothetical protein